MAVKNTAVFGIYRTRNSVRPARFVRDLQLQIEIRLARQNLIAVLHSHPKARQCAELVEH